MVSLVNRTTWHSLLSKSHLQTLCPLALLKTRALQTVATHLPHMSASANEKSRTTKEDLPDMRLAIYLAQKMAQQLGKR